MQRPLPITFVEYRCAKRLHITLATIFRRFDFELYGTTREDDIDTARDCFLAETIPGSLGVRAKVVKIYEQ
jgi:hypothetical protein